MITALVVDDEPKAVEQMASLLQTFPGVDVIGTALDVDDAERFLQGRVPDVVFLDINMPGRLGFDLVSSVPVTTRVVFVTADEGRAIDAFRVGAVDYLLKPVDRDRLTQTIDRLQGWLPADRTADDADGLREATDDDAAEATDGTNGTIRLTLAGGRGIETVAGADIAWVEAVRNYTRVQVRERRPQLVRRTLAEWEAVLQPPAFGRVSRSLIVQLAAIHSTKWQSRHQTLVYFTGVEPPLPLGRAATTRLKELLPR